MGTSISKYPVTCQDCGNVFEQTKLDSDDDFQTHYLPNACPQCGGKNLGPFDPSRSQKKVGNKSLCGRCQGTKRNFGPGTVLVTNAPGSVHNSWCHTCVSEVNEGGPPVIPGVSINREGFVIPGRPPTSRDARSESKETVVSSPEERLTSITAWLVTTAWVDGVIAVMLLFSLLVILPISLTPKGSPGYDANSPHPVFLIVFVGLSAVRAYFLVRGVLKLKTRESHRDAYRTATLTAIPVGGFCFLSVPVGIGALLVFSDPEVARLFAQDSPKSPASPAPTPAVPPADQPLSKPVGVQQVSVACPNCDKRASVPQAFIGKRVKCKGCRHPFVLQVPRDE